jgi:hypothetical protein
MTTPKPPIVTKTVGPGMSDGVKNFMNVQNAHVNVHVVYPIFDLVDIPSRSVSRYGLTSALRLSCSPAKQSEWWCTIVNYPSFVVLVLVFVIVQCPHSKAS